MQELSKHRFSGVFTALVTPMKDGEIDHAAVERHVEAQLAAGIHGLVVLGTTGEAATLSESEAERLLRQIVEMAKGRCTVVAGAGSNDTVSAIAKARHAASIGADALLVVTPYYNKPSQAGLVAHFSAVAGSVDIPIMLYNVPGRTGVDLAVDGTARLARDFSNVIGIKEAGGRVERVTELKLACGEDFIIHSGDDNLTLPFLAVGADGVTSVASNLFPAELVALFAAWSQGDAKGARQRHQQLFEAISLLFVESNPVPVKAALALRGAMGDEVRAPLVGLSARSQHLLQDCLRRYDEAKHSSSLANSAAG